jgi:hypothetical protein
MVRAVDNGLILLEHLNQNNGDVVRELRRLSEVLKAHGTVVVLNANRPQTGQEKIQKSGGPRLELLD